jgi:hypothetical protein
VTTPMTPDTAACTAAPAAVSGLDANDLARILADASDIEAHRLSIVGHHTMDASGPLLLALSRIAGLREQIEIEVRLVRRYLGGA